MHCRGVVEVVLGYPKGYAARTNQLAFQSIAVKLDQ